jgi:hypothetical protein
MEEKSKVYIETSVVSYLVAKPSMHLITLAHQQITLDWWTHELPKYVPFISSSVTEEAKMGDQEYSQKRLKALEGFKKLEQTPIVLELANEYLTTLHMPEKCRVDCIHMATASVYQMDFMASWNCKHIANANIKRKIKESIPHLTSTLLKSLHRKNSIGSNHDHRPNY